MIRALPCRFNPECDPSPSVCIGLKRCTVVTHGVGSLSTGPALGLDSCSAPCEGAIQQGHPHTHGAGSTLECTHGRLLASADSAATDTADHRPEGRHLSTLSTCRERHMA